MGGSEKIQVDLGGGFCGGSSAALAHGCFGSADGWGESDGREGRESGRGSQVEEEREGERAKKKKNELRREIDARATSEKSKRDTQSYVTRANRKQHSALIKQARVAEWLRRSKQDRVAHAIAGSNPASGNHLFYVL